MEKRYGSILILVKDKAPNIEINTILSKYAECILSRTGLPLKDQDVSLISVIFKSDIQTINALSGQLGRLQNIEVKTCIHKKLNI